MSTTTIEWTATYQAEGRKRGAMKIAAKKIGITFDEYAYRQSVGEKWCYKCRGWKEVEHFSPSNSLCRKCKANLQHIRRLVHKPIKPPYQRKDLSRPGLLLRQQMAQHGLKWCCDCKAWLPQGEVRRGRCKPHTNASYRQYYAHQGKSTIAQRAHARKRGVAPVPTIVQECLLESFQGKCAYCGVKDATTWDHIVPISKGGRTIEGNIVPACVSCNSSKKSQDVFVWVQGRDQTKLDGFFDELLLTEVGYGW